MGVLGRGRREIESGQCNPRLFAFPATAFLYAYTYKRIDVRDVDWEAVVRCLTE